MGNQCFELSENKKHNYGMLLKHPLREFIARDAYSGK